MDLPYDFNIFAEYEGVEVILDYENPELSEGLDFLWKEPSEPLEGSLTAFLEVSRLVGMDRMKREKVRPLPADLYFPRYLLPMIEQMSRAWLPYLVELGADGTFDYRDLGWGYGGIMPWDYQAKGLEFMLAVGIAIAPDVCFPLIEETIATCWEVGLLYRSLIRSAYIPGTCGEQRALPGRLLESFRRHLAHGNFGEAEVARLETLVVLSGLDTRESAQPAIELLADIEKGAGKPEEFSMRAYDLPEFAKLLELRKSTVGPITVPAPGFSTKVY